MKFIFLVFLCSILAVFSFEYRLRNLNKNPYSEFGKTVRQMLCIYVSLNLFDTYYHSFIDVVGEDDLHFISFEIYDRIWFLSFREIDWKLLLPLLLPIIAPFFAKKFVLEKEEQSDNDILDDPTFFT